MADGASGNIGGILFEAGKTISDAGKKQAQQVANAVGGQLGAQKPLFGGQKTQTTGLGGLFPQKPAGGATGGQTSKIDPFGDFGKMFEGGKPGFGSQKPPAQMPQSQQFSQAQLDTMAAQNKAVDDQEIAKRQAELQQIKLQHKQLHDEMYYNAIRDAGKNSIAKDRKEKAQAEQQQEEAKAQQQQQVSQMSELPGNMMGNNPQLGAPVAVTQAKTQTEANRGTTG